MNRTVTLAGIGHDFPGAPLTNHELTSRYPELDADDAWITRHTGVHARHWPAEDEHHVDLAERAARMALKHSGLRVGDLDAIIGTSATVRPSTNPSTSTNRYMEIALPLQGRLGATYATSFDVSGTACAGFLFASAIARDLILGSGLETVLVACAEKPEPILNFKYRNSTLFGGGAAVGIWQGSNGEPGLEEVVLRTDPTHYAAFNIDDEAKMIMKGNVVGEFAPGALAEVTREALSRQDLSWDDIDWVVPHQGNASIIRDYAEVSGVPREKVLINIDRRGNTSSVSVPGCLSEHVHNGTINPGDRILSISIGRGFAWGALLFSYRGAGQWKALLS